MGSAILRIDSTTAAFQIVDAMVNETVMLGSAQAVRQYPGTEKAGGMGQVSEETQKHCNLYFGPEPCTGDVYGHGMCGVHYQRWRKGHRGAVLDRHRGQDHRALRSVRRFSQFHASLAGIAIAQAAESIDQGRLLNAAALIVSFAARDQ